jgi:putative resolvase
MYLSAHQATKKLGVSSDTLRRWLKQGKITAKTSPSGTRLYNISIFPELTSQNVETTTTTTAATTTKKGFLYARVSSIKQKEDLERQKQLLSSRFPTYELVSDIGSGVNFKRPGLKTLLEQSSRRVVSEIVVTHRDRLCRFAFDLIQYVLSLHATKIVVLFNDATSDEHELSQDILAINTVFICRLQGKRAALHRRERQNRRNKQEEESQCNKSTHQTTTLERNYQSYTTSQSVPQPFSETITETLDGIGEVCL